MVKTTSCSLQMDRGVPFLRKTPIQLIEHGEVIWSLHGALTPKLQSLWHGKVLCRVLKEEDRHQLSHDTFDLQSLLLEKYGREMVAQNLW